MLLLEPKQQVASLLHGAEPFRVGLDVAGVGTRYLSQLRRAREGGIEQLLPFADRRIEAQQVAEDLLRLGEAGRVHRLFQVARQTTQLIGVRQALRLCF